MNSKSIPSANQKSAALIDPHWDSESQWDHPEFDQWMTRQLNCLVGRNMAWSTRSSSARRNQTNPR